MKLCKLDKTSCCNQSQIHIKFLEIKQTKAEIENKKVHTKFPVLIDGLKSMRYYPLLVLTISNYH